MEEKQLILNCQNGDSAAFGQLYDKYFQKIYRFIYYKTSHKETSEDLTSLTFSKALEKIQSFDTSSSFFSAWLYKIARNNLIDYYRSNKETTSLEENFMTYDDKKLEENISQKQELEKITEKLDSLSPQQKEIIIMRVWNELSYKEISQIVGKSEGSCKMTFSRAIKQLKLSLTILILFITLIIN
ncbi:RNA polymerase sigma factor [Patescibacteria group bacterium]|nr:RNA polymerase sigma factor [Patescibacteria group bacterium]